MSNFWQGFDDVRPEDKTRQPQPRIIVDINDIGTDQQKPLIARFMRPPIKVEPQPVQSQPWTTAPASGFVAPDIASVVADNKWIVLGAIAVIGYLWYSNSLTPADRTVTSITKYGRR